MLIIRHGWRIISFNRLQFHWDRQGNRDERSSCWIRTSQAWAGGAWGGMSIPRIGHEVIVDFLEGDPDRPIVTGRVYHGNRLKLMIGRPWPTSARHRKTRFRDASILRRWRT